MHKITNSGWVEVITGCMFSGKTEELLRRLRRAEIAGQDVAAFKPSVDDRYGEATVGSHNGRQWDATVVEPDEGVSGSSEGRSPSDRSSGQRPREDEATGGTSGAKRTGGVWDIPDQLNGEAVVAFDEANFFSDELVEVCEFLAADDRRVIVSGTDQTFRGEPFEPLPRLVALAEYVDKYQAICAQCGEPATRNQRLVDGEPAHVDDPTIVVGADESYEARCRNCHTLRTE